MSEENTQDRPPAAFRRYVLREHERYANAQEGPGRQFRNLQLHASNVKGWENVPNRSLHFTHAFERYLDNGIKDQRRERDQAEHDYRWARVEAAIVWLEHQDPGLAEILRYFQQPAYVRPASLITFAGRFGLTTDGLEKRCAQALRRIWWKLGRVF